MKPKEAAPELKPWTPISGNIVVARLPPEPDPEEVEARTQRRDVYAASARSRLDEWRAKGPHDENHPILMHPNDHCFRDRVKTGELAGEWNSADKVLSQRDRISRAVATHEAAFLHHPPYPKSGGGVKNVDFSYMSSGYNYRQRLPSKEVAGTWSIMRVRPHTESARINEEAAQHRPRDTLGGGRWTIDRKYGNPPVHTPVPTGDFFRKSAAKQWVAGGWAGGQSPPPTAPESKWRGGFKTNFPPKVMPGTETMSSSKPWLMPSDEFKDQFHDTVAIHTASLPAEARTRFRPTRDKGKELTGGDGATQYWPQTPVNVYLPNPSPTCTWNQLNPPSPVPPRTYPKSYREWPLSPRGMEEGSIVSASLMEPALVASGSM